MTIVLQFADELTEDEMTDLSAGMMALLDERALAAKISDALGDGWAMDNPADKAAAVDAVLQVVAEEVTELMLG